MRKSKTTKLDCRFLLIKTQKLQQALMEFSSNGFQNEGLNDDMFCKVEAMTLKKALEEYLGK